MLRNEFKNEVHNFSARLSVNQLENELVSTIQTLKNQEQELREKKEIIQAHQSLNQQFSALARRQDTMVETAVTSGLAEMSGMGAADSLFMVGEAFMDQFTASADLNLTSMDKSILVDVLADMRDQSVNKRTKSVRKFLNQDLYKQAQLKGQPLANANTVEGNKQRLDLMTERLEQVQFSKSKGLRDLEVGSNGIAIPSSYIEELNLKKQGYQAQLKSQSNGFARAA